MTEDEVTEFIIGRLAELIVALLAQKPAMNDEDQQLQHDAKAILMTLGSWAAKHGRADLMPILHGLAQKVAPYEPPKIEPFGEPPLSLTQKLVRRVNYRW